MKTTYYSITVEFPNEKKAKLFADLISNELSPTIGKTVEGYNVSIASENLESIREVKDTLNLEEDILEYDEIYNAETQESYTINETYIS